MNIKKVIKLIEETRNAYEKAQKLEEQVFCYFENNNIDLTSYLGGCNSDNLQEMITCYFMYRDDSIEEIENRLKMIEVNK